MGVTAAPPPSVVNHEKEGEGEAPLIVRLCGLMADDASTFFASVSTALAITAAAAAYAIYRRRAQGSIDAPAGVQLQQQQQQPQQPQQPPSAPQQKKRRSNKKSQSGKSDDGLSSNERALSDRPPLAVGQKCWHRQAQQEVTILKVYYDDLPPYYAVAFPDGSERATVRARLDTFDEREAEAALEETRAAEARADAAAAALLAEEEAASKRPANSGGRGDRAAVKTRASRHKK